MPAIDLASRDDGPAIQAMTAMAGVFTAEELGCVEDIWNAFLGTGEASGYTFLVYRDDFG